MGLNFDTETETKTTIRLRGSVELAAGEAISLVVKGVTKTKTVPVGKKAVLDINIDGTILDV